jgi:hypothetical protein
MIKAYYDSFYLEVVRMSNAHIGGHFEGFISLVTKLIKRPGRITSPAPRSASCCCTASATTISIS